MERKKNVVGLAGRIAGEIEKQPDIYGARNLSRLYLEIERKGGSRQDGDRVIVIYGQEAEATPGQLEDGAYVMLWGKCRPIKRFRAGISWFLSWRSTWA